MLYEQKLKSSADMIKRIIRFKRKPATHIFIFMISSELREKKPYALPVQCISYAGMKETDIHRLVTELIAEMINHVAGTYSFVAL